MALQASGAISMSEINTELGRSSTSAIQLKKANGGDYGLINHSGGHDGSAPYSMGEWHSYYHFPDFGVETGGIVDYWDARIQGLSANDWNSIYGNDTVMSLNNSPTYNQSAPYNFSFDGTNDYGVTDDTITLGSRWSIAIWMRHTADQSANYERLFAMWDYQFDVAEDTDGKMRIYDGAWSTINAIDFGDTQNWQHLVFVYDDGASAGESLKIYHQNSLESTTGDGRSITGKKIYLGSKQAVVGEHWEGEIGQFILWGQALTEQQIDALYDNDKTYFVE